MHNVLITLLWVRSHFMWYKLWQSILLCVVYVSQKNKNENARSRITVMQTCYSPLHPYVLSISGYESIVRHIEIKFGMFYIKIETTCYKSYCEEKRILKVLLYSILYKVYTVIRHIFNIFSRSIN